ncbi:MAG: FGGY family carbohydrate kinase [Sphaerochaetaceae bacterium]|jgi:xylulokinase|nr:FGGY family carbohydrate kinase [Sphaerochaetaceae bacterium]MDD2405061.1 FGGY family carbohydrate kinase [Sphaerochaetaceae bacterium]MDD3669701.1 FGGY family carbohydrate kinase [Sphaerochaetaceae bacterium]MDD4258612.1 FGGY family carbohydrate kinase [Sphaerochaetaceae bacterium]MDD4840353.1 FGGY family carbohydrate kinase [Sphaerochaetaceae bacterium]
MESQDRDQTFVIGIDIGTQGVKGAMFRSDGHCIAEYGESSQLLHPEPQAITEDPEFQYNSVLRVIKACLEQAKAQGINNAASKVAALAIDGQMAGIIGVGKDGKAITPYDSWLDTRCAPYLEKMRYEANDLILGKAGTAPSINHGPKKLWWKHEHPEVFANIVKFVQPGAYAAARLSGLSGEQGFIDRTYLHFSGFSDTAHGVWDKELCDLFNLPMEKLPNIVESTAIVGSVSKEAASICNLIQGTPIAAGCGDTVASFLSSGAVEEGISVDVAGTASVFACTHKQFAPDHKSKILGCCASVVPGLWYSYAYINGGGMNPEWFVKNFGDASGSLRFKELEDQIEHLEDSLTLPLFIPHMAGRVMPGRPDLRGSFAGMNWDHGKVHLFRAILEGVALEYGLYKEAAVALQPDLKINEIRVTGGGQKSVVWNTMKSGVLRAPVVRIKRNQGAPLGIAMVAAVASGLFKSFPEASKKWIATGDTVVCEPNRYEFYSKRLAAYRQLLDSMERFTETYPFKD